MPKPSSLSNQITVRLNDRQLSSLEACSIPLGLTRTEFLRLIVDFFPLDVDTIKFSNNRIEIVCGSHLVEIKRIDLDHLPY